MAGLWERMKFAATAFRNATEMKQSFDAMNHDMVRSVFGHVTAAGRSVTDETAMAISTTWACRRILSESMGMLPWQIFKKESNGSAVPATAHPLAHVLGSAPNADQTDVEFRECLTLNLTGRGNAYCYIEMLGKYPGVLTPIPSASVRPMRKRGTNTRLSIPDGAVFFRVNDRGAPEDFPREKVWHTKLFGDSTLEGLNPVQHAAEAMGGALAMEEFGNRFFAQGATGAGTVTYPGWLKPDQKKDAEDAMRRIVGGLGSAHTLALLQGGMKIEKFSSQNLEELQLIVARKFSVIEICRFYLVPPHRVFELEKGASYASIEQMSQDFIQQSLLPYFRKFEASMERWLLPPSDRGKYFMRFNYDALLRATSKERAEVESIWVQNGIMSRNEVRAKENLNRVEHPNMDKLTVQLNLTPIDKLGQEAKPPAAPPRREVEPQDQLTAAVMAYLGAERTANPELEKLVALLVARELAPKDRPAPAHPPDVIVKQTFNTLADSSASRVLEDSISRVAAKALEDVNSPVKQAATEEAHKAIDETKRAETRTARRLEEHESRMEERIEVMREQFAQQAQELVAKVIAEARKPRKAVFDEHGEPIGTIQVDSIDDLKG
jgi:HK97 family phage portal protein